MGFGENHNQAFQYANGDFFLVLNPDIRLINFDITYLLSLFHNLPNAGVISPMAMNSLGLYDGNARKFPSISNLFSRYILKRTNYSDYVLNCSCHSVDWVGGMFMLFRSKKFYEINGFDTGFYMYLEDVDICYRIKETGGEIILITNLTFVHEAQRKSFKSLTFLKYHILSFIRYFIKYPRQIFSC
jgi:GT2 family glycosyltransferase